jgi:hypothetical protein
MLPLMFYLITKCEPVKYYYCIPLKRHLKLLSKCIDTSAKTKQETLVSYKKIAVIKN